MYDIYVKCRLGSLYAVDVQYKQVVAASSSSDGKQQRRPAQDSFWMYAREGYNAVEYAS